MTRNRRWGVVVGAAVLTGLVLVGLYAGLLAVTGGFSSVSPWGGRFRSNGEQIYFIATSQRGTPITSDMGMGMMQGRMMTCATCHGADGRGGQVRMMMGVFEAPDVRYQTLTSEEHGEEGEEGMEHETFTDETIKQAITIIIRVISV